ncbi:MAG TPA: M20 family metallopeptidase [Chthoniobacterales bacterium]|nr:M20 family metallopeptidase [Chthoniobacterales bacterium]
MSRSSSVTEILMDLIAIPSVSSASNRAVIDYARQWLTPNQWTIRTFPYADPNGIEKINLVAAPRRLLRHGRPDEAFASPIGSSVTRGSREDDVPSVELALVCHTDTVPYPDDWPEAVHPKVMNGRVYGRGACDVKGFLACILAAVGDPELAEQSLAVVLTADEEIGCVGAKRLLGEKRLNARNAVVGEPTQLHPVVAGKGYALGEVVVRGKAAHSAFPQAGRSAILDAVTLIDSIRKIGLRAATERHERFDPPFTTVNIGTISGGTAKNIVPAECRFLVEWRPVPGQNERWIADLIREELARAQREDPELQATFEPIRIDPGFETDSQSKLVGELERLSGNAAVAVAFGTEAPYLKKLGAETVVFGPGDMKTAHSVEENVPVEELERCVEILSSLTARIANNR